MPILCFSTNILPDTLVNLTEVLPQEATDTFTELVSKVYLLGGYLSFYKNKIPLPVDAEEISTCEFPTDPSNMPRSHAKGVLVFGCLKGFLKKALGVPLPPLDTLPHHSGFWHAV
jgi:hypothetical protein